MKIRYTLRGIHFEWDSIKAESNIKDHGISFETACEVFFDPFVKFLNEEEIEGELRESIVGMTNTWQILYVVHTIREGDSFRIISARRVTSRERNVYEQQ